jgi:hypothetical protein
VKDTARVDEVERVQDLANNGRGLAGGQLPAAPFEVIPQGGTLDPVHDEADHARLHDQVAKTDEAWMLQRREDEPFLQKAGDRLGVATELGP